MWGRIKASLEEGRRVHEQLLDRCGESIADAADVIVSCLQEGGKLLTFGNGGSAADAQHLASEFVGRFRDHRAAIPAIALTTDTSALTSIGNDYDFDHIFARQVEALGTDGDVALAISTSGSSSNVVAAVKAAQSRGITVIGLTGGAGGHLKDLADISIVVPSLVTARIQEAHITIGHLLCEAVEDALFAPGLSRERRHIRVDSKIIDEANLVNRGEIWRRRGRTIVWTNGCFDLLHAGHIRSLQAASSFGDVLIVGVNSDDSVRSLKGPQRPINPLEQRLEVLAALECVNYVVAFDDRTPMRILGAVRPHVHCKGADYADGKEIPEAAVVEAYGGRIEFLPIVPGISTTELAERLRGTEAENSARA